MTIEEIAQYCHEFNRVICEKNGDFSQKSWTEAEYWQKRSAINGVRYRLNNPASSPVDQHNEWSKEKVLDGWVYGEEKDAEKKTHPCLVPYAQLPSHQKLKDSIFCATVDACREFLTETVVTGGD
jgi:hypothetical protein